MSATVTAILLAAGRSRRMGSCKQLLPIGGTTVIGHCLETLRSGGVSDIAVVVSQDGHEVATAARKHSALIVENPEPDGDMASSVRYGRDALGGNCKGVVVALCDYPLVMPATINMLLQVNHLFPDGIITPIHQGRRGHPLIFARSILNELKPGMTMRDLLHLEPARVYALPVDDPGILIDIDTPEDYTRVRSMSGGI